ncbi:MAG TPA: hypothetical protein VFP80_15585 [Thermoanaerobaculia bacterium]|nr:hypothetical protein [Thermoanaerobaculia bacterium]
MPQRENFYDPVVVRDDVVQVILRAAEEKAPQPGDPRVWHCFPNERHTADQCVRLFELLAQ